MKKKLSFFFAEKYGTHIVIWPAKKFFMFHSVLKYDCYNNLGRHVLNNAYDGKIRNFEQKNQTVSLNILQFDV